MIDFATRSAMERVALEYHIFHKINLDEAIDRLLSAVLSPPDLLVWRCGERLEWLGDTIDWLEDWLSMWLNIDAR